MKNILLAVICTMATLQISATAKPTSILYQGYDNGNWQDNTLQSNTYDGNGNLTSQLYQGWDSLVTAWVNISLITYNNNSNGTVNTELLQTWDSTAGTWDNVNMYTYTYNGSDSIATQLYQTWTGSAWQNTYLYTNTYDGNGYRISQQTQTWSTSGSTWNNYVEYVYDNNSNGTVNYYVYLYWDVSSYDSSARYSFTYNGGNHVLTELTQVYASGVWQNSSQEAYSYDGNGYLISETIQNWQVGSSSWINYELFNDINNTDGSVHDILYQDWNIASSIYDSVSNTIYYYGLTGVADVPAISARIYPNPATDMLHIDIKGTNQPYDVSLTDMTGRTLRDEHELSGDQAIDISSLSSGVYLVNVMQAGASTTQRVVKQ